MSKKLYNKAIDKWGEIAQLEQAIEEMSELIFAIQKLKRYDFCKERYSNVIEEVADVTIMMEQLTLILGEEEVEKVKLEKLKKLEGKLTIF